MQYSGPRPACKDLDGLMDEIGDPAVDLIKSLKLSPETEAAAIVKLNEIIMEPFSPSGSTGLKLRNYIYELNRELSK